jgi:hypothetical protein
MAGWSPDSPADPLANAGPWTARRFFSLLGALGRLRVISQSGPSTFEALCRVGPFEVARGFVNALTPEYHWHLAVKRFRHLRSHDEVHARSGRRVLFFALAEAAGEAPFLRIYLHREKGEEFDPDREARFRAAHGALCEGVAVEPEADA